MRRLPPLLVCLALGACAANPGREADRPYTAGLARIASVEVPPQDAASGWVEALARGVLPDPCTALESADVRRRGASFEVVLATRRPFGAHCPQEPVPFTRRIVLRMEPGETGAYFVTVNGVTTAFSITGRDTRVHPAGDFD